MQSVNKNIEELLANEYELCKYIVFLINTDPLLHSYELTFEKLLVDERDNVKEAAVNVLLYHLRSKNPKVRELAIKYYNDRNSDYDLRLSAMSGIALTYFGSKDVLLMKSYMDIYKDESEEKSIRRSALEDLLLVYGISSREVCLRSGSIYIDSSKFNKELIEIEKKLNV